MKSPESELNEKAKKAYDIYMEELRQAFRPMAFKFTKLWTGKGVSDEAELRHLARIDIQHKISVDLIGPKCDKTKD